MRPTWPISLCSLFLFSACSTPSDGPLDGGTVDAAPSITSAAMPPPTGSLFETEPTIAATSDGKLALAWLDITPGGKRNTTVGYAFSTDHGDTWSAPQLMQLPDARFASNEIVAAGPRGDLYLVTLGVLPDVSGAGVFFSKAAGSSFGPLTEVSDPSVATMRDASSLGIAHDGSINIVWTEYLPNNTTQVVVARSTDEGNTWTRKVLSAPSDGGVWTNLCVSRSDNRVAVVYIHAGSTHVAWSADGGATWADADRNELVVDTHVAEFPSCVVDGQDLWVMQGTSSQDLPTSTFAPLLDDIQLNHSGDGGRNFDAVVSAQDPNAGSKYMRAFAALNPDRSLSLVYYAGTADDDAHASVRVAISTDLGKSFGPSQVLYAPILLTTKRVGSSWLGDLLGVAADARSLHVGLVDNASGTAHVRYARLTH